MITKIILKFLSFVVFVLEKIKNFHEKFDENDDSKKIVDRYDFEKSILFIGTDKGYKPASSLFMTQPYHQWTIFTESGKKLICADNHLVFGKGARLMKVSDLEQGDYISTRDGYEEVVSCKRGLRKSMMYDVEIASLEHRYFTDDILSHNTITSSIYIVWYLLFNIDKNVLVLANKGITAEEIVDKIKTIFKNLPFFLKPGMIINNVMTMKFDNGCRLKAMTTTKSAAIGFSIHLAYMDEFAHIQESFLNPFYRSVYPTISASKISRVIITSTPNGRNKFFDIYQGAVDHKNEYNPIRVDWWQVPDRDEAWKAKEIANLGSIENFNQEYGNQFLSGDTLLLGGDALRTMKRMAVKYQWRPMNDFEDEDVKYDGLTWDPSFDFYDIDFSKFVFSIDIADGVGNDYSVINIFKIESMSFASMRRLRNDRFDEEIDFFRLRQVGIFRSNETDAEDLAKIAAILLYKVFDPDNVRISLEMNFKGDMFVDRISRYDDYYEDIFLHTRHNERTKKRSIGIKIHKFNKLFFCREFRKYMMEKRIVLNDIKTFEELSDFGLNGQGTYSSQSGHDDISMTCVNLVPMLKSESYSYLVEEMYDSIDEEKKKLIEDRMGEDAFKDEDFEIMSDLMKMNETKWV